MELLKKLNYKNQKEIVIYNSPEEFKVQLKEISGSVPVKTNIPKNKTEFFLIFVKNIKELNQFVGIAVKNIEDDGILWFAYPKKSSKKYITDISRDSGWQALFDLDFEPVRLVAIDDDWSALRFKKVENIKTMTRSSAKSKAGMEKVGNK